MDLSADELLYQCMARHFTWEQACQELYRQGYSMDEAEIAIFSYIDRLDAEYTLCEADRIIRQKQWEDFKGKFIEDSKRGKLTDQELSKKYRFDITQVKYLKKQFNQRSLADFLSEHLGKSRKGPKKGELPPKT